MKKRQKIRLAFALFGSGIVLIALSVLVWHLRAKGGSATRDIVPWGKPNRPHVIVISLDTTRADHFGYMGNKWIQTPNMDRLAKESIVFTDYMTVVPTTLASHTTLFTGKYPHHHGAARNGFTVNEKNLMLAEVLRANGYHTEGFLAAFALHSRFGFSQGFDAFDEDFGINKKGKPINQRPASSVTKAVSGRLNQLRGDDSLFLFIHFFDPHTPYRPPASYRKQYEVNDSFKRWLGYTQNPEYQKRRSFKKATRYAGEISYMDHHLGNLLDYLKKRAILDNAILVITSDHGETFWEHNHRWNHGLDVYQTTMHTVLLVRLPDANKAGMRVDDLIGNIDIMPTLLQYLGLPLPGGMDGRAVDLKDATVSVPKAPIFGQATQPWRNNLERGQKWPNSKKARCVREGDYKYVQTPFLDLDDELYNVKNDPFEKKNLLLQKSLTPNLMTMSKDLKDKLETWVDSADPLPSQFINEKTDETIERLKNLGYIEESSN